jgi:DNA repair exonuclease SbcCD nuclease subunit
MNTERRPLKLLHAADCHLGLDYDPAHAARAFEALVSLAIAEAVDCVLLAGDLFDHNRVTAEVVEFAAAQINRMAAPWVVLPGNHDQYDGRSVHHRFHLPQMCGPVRMLTEVDGAAVSLPGLGLTVWGRPVVDHCPEFQPLRGAPTRSGGGWQVAMAHGFHVPEGEATYRSSPIRAEEIGGLTCDYLALGHVHRFLDVSAGDTKACYAGPSFSMESGPVVMGSAALVALDPAAGVSVTQLRYQIPAAG